MATPASGRPDSWAAIESHRKLETEHRDQGLPPLILAFIDDENPPFFQP